jgi:hypothetical protein
VVVCQLEHVLRSTQHGHDAGRLGEQVEQALVFLVAVFLGQHLVGDLDAGAVHAADLAVSSRTGEYEKVNQVGSS